MKRTMLAILAITPLMMHAQVKSLLSPDLRPPSNRATPNPLRLPASSPRTAPQPQPPSHFVGVYGTGAGVLGGC